MVDVLGVYLVIIVYRKMLVLVLFVLKEVLNEEFICYKYIKEVFGVEVLYIKKSLYMYLFYLIDGCIFVFLLCIVFC